MVGVVEPTDQEEAPHFQVSSMRGVHQVTVLFERHPGRVECFRGPAEVARHESDLSLGDDAPRAGHGLSGTKGTRSASQESFRSSEIAELRHRDASKRERRRIITQGDALQCAKRITRCQRTRRSRD
jgi:hypothetical protein